MGRDAHQMRSKCHQFTSLLLLHYLASCTTSTHHHFTFTLFFSLAIVQLSRLARYAAGIAAPDLRTKSRVFLPPLLFDFRRETPQKQKFVESVSGGMKRWLACLSDIEIGIATKAALGIGPQPLVAPSV